MLTVTWTTRIVCKNILFKKFKTSLIFYWELLNENHWWTYQGSKELTGLGIYWHINGLNECHLKVFIIIVDSWIFTHIFHFNLDIFCHLLVDLFISVKFGMLTVRWYKIVQRPIENVLVLVFKAYFIASSYVVDCRYLRIAWLCMRNTGLNPI